VLSTSTKGASAGTTTPIDIFDGDNKLDLRYVTGLSMAREDRLARAGHSAPVASPHLYSTMLASYCTAILLDCRVSTSVVLYTQSDC